MATIVLVCLGNFQEYIMTNIVNLVKLGHADIHVIVSRNIKDEFEPLLNLITLAYADDLEDEFVFNRRSQLDKQFRDGFWHYTSMRLFVLYAYMKSKQLEHVVHLENDVLIYHHCNMLGPIIEKKAIYMPFDSYGRNIASIMYIPDAYTLGQVLKTYDYSKNDMQNFAKHCYKQCDSKQCDSKQCDNNQCDSNPLVERFPICVPIPGMTEEQLWVSRPINSPFIFDAAAIGQMVGGVDPRNIAGDTRGFVNEECVIKYNDYGTIVWIDFKPYYRLHVKGIAIDRDIPIFNLHIHSKNLHLY